MPFTLELVKIQDAALWTVKQTPDANRLQKLLDAGKRQDYVGTLLELSKPNAQGQKRNFIKTSEKVYEMFDEGEHIKVPVRFQVKGPVITWAFNCPKDQTHQEFRDLVFNTAAKAHTCVANSCETYYRGTNHYHFKVMHSYSGENDFNHNHYRTADDGPITPKEVYEHIMAFCAQKTGRQFIPSSEERDDIILKYTLYWAEDNLDINYVIFSMLVNRAGGSNKVISQLKEIALLGRLTPDQADSQLDLFFSSPHGKNMLNLALSQEDCSWKKEDLEGLKNAIKADYRTLFRDFAPQARKQISPEMEPYPEVTGGSKSSSSRRPTPREEYSSQTGQTLDEIDIAEYNAFASLLTKHCHSIDKSLLQDLEFDDFRKALLLYFALRTAQNAYPKKPEGEQRFHPEFDIHQQIKNMIKELPSLLAGSTEDDIGSPLLNKLIHWVRTAPPELERWVEWVKVNGSRGLGSEIADIRQMDGRVNLAKAVPKEDRTQGAVAEIDFDQFDLSKIFNVTQEQDSKKHHELREKLTKQLGQLVRLKRLTQIDESEFRDKTKVIDAALSVLAGRKPLSFLSETIKTSPNWSKVSIPGVQSALVYTVKEILALSEPPRVEPPKLSH